MSSVETRAGVSGKRRRLLLSAFACSPLQGSEPGVGWQWLNHLAHKFDVVLLTHAYFRSHIEPALETANLKVEVHYLQAPAFGMHPLRQLNSRGYYVFWQWQARAVVKRLVAERSFDLIHHLTWGTVRFPCFLTGMGVPLVMGPLGGGEDAPLRLLDGLPLKIRAFDYLRSATLALVRFDPFAMWGPRQAALVICKSRDSLLALSKPVQAHAVVSPEIGSPAVDISQRRTVDDRALNTPETSGKTATASRRYRLLFAGRLLGWKGVALALGATRLLLQAGHDVQLDIAGEGPLKHYLKLQIDRHNLQDRVHLLGGLPRNELMQLYAASDLFVFPSLHDSSGNVVLESLSRGLPVVCVDLGGPQLYVDNSCGVVVKTTGLTRQQLEQRIADEIAAVLSKDGELSRLSRGASIHAARQTWAHAVQRSYDLISERLNWAEA